MTQANVSRAYALPVQWSELLSARLAHACDLGALANACDLSALAHTCDLGALAHACDLSALAHALSADPPGTSTRLTRQVHEVLGVPLHVGRSSPEVGAGTTATGLETSLSTVDGTAGLFRIRVRGPSSCLAVWRRDTGLLRLAWQHHDGWFDTGDLIRVDDAGHIDVVRRPSDEVGGLFLVPVAEIEDGLLGHPRVADA